jgi:chloramphenicol-sensitive protein RarD
MSNKGILFGTGAYLLWGFFPIYFKALQNVPALEIMFHRVVWCFVFMVFLISLKKEWTGLKTQIASPKVILIYTLAAGLLSINWLIYIYGVATDQVVETSLGYFINPLLNVALGVLLLRERLRPGQWVPIGLAAAGVIYLTIQYGALPWIALSLAFTFGTYGLVKKVAPLGALYGLTLETAILFLPALAYLMFVEINGSGAFVNAGWGTSLLLSLSGVITALPLLLFAFAARSIPLYMVGILQYISPTCQLLLGVLLYHEPFTPHQMVGFGLVWAALAVYWLEGLVERRRIALAQISQVC